MSRHARTVCVDVPHHVTQRGNYQQVVFTADRHYARYIEWLGEDAARFDLDLLGYCLLPNHVHMVAIPRQPRALAQVFAATHMRLAQMVNRERGGPGHLWQGRFHSCPLDPEHTRRALRCVELNPVRAGLAGEPATWPWSSARAHLGGEPDALLREAPWTAARRQDWAAWLSAGCEADRGPLQKHTRGGWPWGDEAFVAGLEATANRRLRPGKPGRPRRRPEA